MFRAYAYLGVSGLIWLGEGFLFSHFLGMAPWQVVLVVLLYLGLFATVVRYFVLSLRTQEGAPDLARWRAVSVAPMATAIIGSFASLPLIMFVAILGRIV